jgi:hypothetical protein
MFLHFVRATLGIVLATGITSETVAEGRALLTISGEFVINTVGDMIVYDREALTAFPSTTFETSTIWTDGIHTFTGISLQTLAVELGARDGKFLASAINDYTVEIPTTDAVEGGPIIAYLMDGKEMSVRDKGPLWVVYPYDSDSDYRTEVIYSRSIWQLDRLEVVQ